MYLFPFYICKKKQTIIVLVLPSTNCSSRTHLAWSCWAWERWWRAARCWGWCPGVCTWPRRSSWPLCRPRRCTSPHCTPSHHCTRWCSLPGTDPGAPQVAWWPCSPQGGTGARSCHTSLMTGSHEMSPAEATAVWKVNMWLLWLCSITHIKWLCSCFFFIIARVKTAL